MIIATAGHVDHGKSSLTKQLTGSDPDRLAEEKARGLTIDLGFAYSTLESGEILGIVDVPGHERFIANMLAGVGAIDRALLVVAADDGPMPQTCEHLAILDLLQISGGDIVITKIDRAHADRTAAVERELIARTRGTFLRKARVFHVSNQTGEGVGALHAHLSDLAKTSPRRRRAGNFRMTVDRRFTLNGIGLVVTGSAFSGSVATGDHVTIGPGGIDARIRAIHAQNRPVKEGGAGERLALNLAGADVEKNLIARGDWLVSKDANHPTSRIDTRVFVLASEASALQHDLPVHLHIGALDVPARVAVLEGRRIEPNGSGFIQLMLDRPTIAANGDRFVLRDQSARRTIAGGVVLDPFGLSRGRAKPSRLETLAILETMSPDAALARLIEKSEGGVDLSWFARVMNLTSEETKQLCERVSFVRAGGAATPYALTEPVWRSLKEAILAQISGMKSDRGDPVGAPLPGIRQSLPISLAAPVLQSALAELVAEGRLRVEGHLFFSGDAPKPDVRPKNVMGDKILAALRESGVPPATVNQIADETGLNVKLVIGFLKRAATEGAVRRVSESRYFLPESVARLARETESLSGALDGGIFRANDFRNRTGISRNPSIEILEYFDKAGFTRRTGDDRIVVRPAGEVFGDA